MEFIDLKTQYLKIKPQVDYGIQKVLDHGKYIMGPEIDSLEMELATFTGSKYALTCSNGTEALVMALMAIGVGAGDAVFVPSFTFVATAEAVVLVGATPVFVDVDRESYNLSVENLDAAIKMVRSEGGLRPTCIIAVDLFGQPANYQEVIGLAKSNGLLVVADGAQSFGASQNDINVGAIGDITTTSFFPAKPLGCYGDGGAIFTNDQSIAEVIRSIRVHGQGIDRYDNVRIGVNGRMDTIQAAILLEKLKIFPEELVARQRVADRYAAGFLGHPIKTPVILKNTKSAWAQYTILIENRDAVIDYLKKKQIPTAVYYPRPIHTQAPYASFPISPMGQKNTEYLARHVLSLPMHPYLSPEVQDHIILETISAVKIFA